MHKEHSRVWSNKSVSLEGFSRDCTSPSGSSLPLFIVIPDSEVRMIVYLIDIHHVDWW